MSTPAAAHTATPAATQTATPAATQAASPAAAHTAGQITLRRSTAADATEIVRLATIDSAEVPAGPLLLAEVDGALHAALTLADGSVIADPFVPTAALVELLRTRRRSTGLARDRRGLRRLAPRGPRARETVR
jgi:hypothetical protein